MRNWNALQLARAAMIGALYLALTLALSAISFGPVQFRVAEALTLLPVLFPEATAGLFAGCFTANIVGGYGLPDAVIGSLATLIAGLLTVRLREKPFLAALPPVLVNAVAIGLMLHFFAGAPLLITMLYIALGQAAACYALGLPLLSVMRRVLKR